MIFREVGVNKLFFPKTYRILIGVLTAVFHGGCPADVTGVAIGRIQLFSRLFYRSIGAIQLIYLRLISQAI